MNLYGLLFDRSKHESERQRNPKGIGLFFAVIKWHWGRLIGLNLLFIVSCLPVVTIPCAMAAMCKVLGLMLQRRVCYVWHDYWQTFRTEWKRASTAGWGVLLVGVVAAVGMWMYPRIMAAPAGPVLAALCCVAVFLAVASAVTVFPMVVFTDLRIRQIWKNALLLTYTRLPYMLLTIMAIIAVIVAMYAGLPYTAPIMPLFGCSLIGLMGTFTGWQTVKKLVIRDDDVT